MAPARAARRRRVQTGAVPRGTGAHRQPVPGVVPTRPVDAGGRGEHPPRERDQPRARQGERPGARAQGVRRVAAPRVARHAHPEDPLHDHAGEGPGAAAQGERAAYKDLTTLSDSLRSELASTMQNLQGVIANQKETIDALTLQVDAITAENSALRDTLENMSTISNTVYYVVGTKDELEQKGIIQEEGGARFLFVLWKSGKTIVPARTLDPGVFTVADRRHFTELPLPASDKEYRIVSRQDTSALETPPDHDGKISGNAVKIADPAKFWANSKYLIIVEG